MNTKQYFLESAKVKTDFIEQNEEKLNKIINLIIEAFKN
jgi:phosphoheptose isomerase